MPWEREVTRVIARYHEGEIFDQDVVFSRLYLLLREADVDVLVAKISQCDPEIAAGFVEFLRGLHGQRPTYDVMFVTNLQPSSDPPAMVDAIHKWLQSH